VQKIIETINNPDQVSKVVSALCPGAIHLMLDPNGSHVANRCLQKLLPDSKAVSNCWSADSILVFFVSLHIVYVFVLSVLNNVYRILIPWA
jgi:hypothetical protein